MNVLVTGGCGYIGSHVAWELVEAGHRVIIVDNLSTGVVENIPPEARLVVGDVGDLALMRRTLSEHHVDAVMHFAASVVVPESVRRPLDYYVNNTLNTCRLLQACLDVGVGRVVFSSTAAVYGMPEVLPVTEATPTLPINPYGASKLMSEQMLRDASRAHGLTHVILRYFNVAGADPQGRTGQSTPGATHLIKVALQTALGLRPFLEVFGADYPTPDGTGIRDYIHVTDLARAHILALEHLASGGESLTLNCGYGRGYSVLEVAEAVREVTGRPLNLRMAERRAGDPGEIVANADALRSLMDWQPRHQDLRQIVQTAWAWERGRVAAVV